MKDIYGKSSTANLKISGDNWKFFFFLRSYTKWGYPLSSLLFKNSMKVTSKNSQARQGW